MPSLHVKVTPRRIFDAPGATKRRREGFFMPRNGNERKSLRLKEYDYSSNGYYYVTICTRDRECLFGEVVGAAPVPARPWY